ncbi:hypothetical protein KAFR_0K00865 [Kazachstania africana CBS 2517]|uniref:BZIP domain-containing protein n=1 Tax=Kazachstania africana (strain ATCC 22294 / BCRC 22015 / CBS 2517 / CECT 1963 / NBRC 1671 / NRRL Y-8276) TaxID=1071382 RepID=H2B1E2_KAZAF|nr:hypothetical protein KAFR_0K00865 [Kazachstania africana CBS 2517]CCF60442.1 hypothetical protein KAFR_0K00865 [Kazachstania africana CBS 2517]
MNHHTPVHIEPKPDSKSLQSPNELKLDQDWKSIPKKNSSSTTKKRYRPKLNEIGNLQTKERIREQNRESQRKFRERNNSYKQKIQELETKLLQYQTLLNEKNNIILKLNAKIKSLNQDTCNKTSSSLCSKCSDINQTCIKPFN